MSSKRRRKKARKELRLILLKLSCLIAILLIAPLTIEALPQSNVSISPAAKYPIYVTDDDIMVRQQFSIDIEIDAVSGFLSDTTIVSVSPESSAIDVGDTLSVDILVDSNAVIHGFEIILDYDEDLLDVLEVTEGELMNGSGHSTFWFVVATSDSVHVNDAILGPAEVNGPGQLFRVKFEAEAEGQSGLIFKVVDIRDMTNTTIPSKPINGHISIGPTSVKDEDSIQSYLPEEYFLAQNYPNPFNPSTQIEYSLPEETFVSLKVHNINGQLIRTLVTEVQAPGVKIIHWDGKDDRGTNVASGVYFYAIKTENFFQTNRMLLLK